MTKRYLINRDIIMSTNNTFRELLRLGVFDKPNPRTIIATSGRISTRPRRFIEEVFTKGSGCVKMVNRDYTDMEDY